MKVFISYPPFKDKGSPMWTQNRQFQWYHVGSFIYPLVPAMAATLLDQEGFEVVWDDAVAQGKSLDQFFAHIDAEKPDLIAFESKTPIVKRLWALAKDLKARGVEAKLVFFGDHVTAKPEESLAMSPVDYVITGGNYDLSLLAVAKHLRDGSDLPAGVWWRHDDSVRNSGAFTLDFDLNKLPFIDRELTQAHLYGEKWKRRTPFMYTMVGRDCPWSKCTFCSWTTLYPRFKTRTPESLLDEIGYLIDRHGVKEIFDDTGTFPGGNWLKKFCRGMIERKYHKKILFSCNMRFDYLLDPRVPRLMKKAGFRKVKSGLESASDETLSRIRKGYGVKEIVRGCGNAAKAGIDVHLTVIVGYPWETREDAQKTIRLAKTLMAKGDAEMLQATTLVPYPGTPFYEYGLENNLFRFDPEDYDRFDMTEPVLKTPDMTVQEVMAMCQGVYRSFLTPKFVFRRITKTRSAEDLSYLLRGAKAVIGHLRDFGRNRGGSPSP